MRGVVGNKGVLRALLGAAAVVSIGTANAQQQQQEHQQQQQQQSTQPAATPPAQADQSNVRLGTIRVRSPRRPARPVRQTGPVQAVQPAPVPRESAYGPVQGYVANQSATGTKTDTPLREIPQSITVVTADRMKDMGVTTVQEAFRYVPGVMADAYGPDSRVDSLKIRGSEPDTYLDGMRTTNSWFNYQRIDPYALERAEVLRGPASVLYGSTTTAGLVNLVSKRPQALDYHEIGVQYGSFNRKQIQTDHTGKMTPDGHWLLRFIAVGRDCVFVSVFV
jgi:iron complex outermembrane receptor protein